MLLCQLTANCSAACRYLYYRISLLALVWKTLQYAICNKYSPALFHPRMHIYFYSYYQKKKSGEDTKLSENNNQADKFDSQTRPELSCRHVAPCLATVLHQTVVCGLLPFSEPDTIQPQPPHPSSPEYHNHQHGHEAFYSVWSEACNVEKGGDTGDKLRFCTYSQVFDTIS